MKYLTFVFITYLAVNAYFATGITNGFKQLQAERHYQMQSIGE